MMSRSAMYLSNQIFLNNIFARKMAHHQFEKIIRQSTAYLSLYG